MAKVPPLVSIIIPMYNTEKYLAECLESILLQTFENFELIIVNHCSTDNSVKIVEKYIPKFNGRLKLFHMEKNLRSPSFPRNKGLEFSSGKYIYFMDSDDVILPDALENLCASAKKTKADLLICKKHLISAGEGENFLKEVQLKGNPEDKSTEQFADNLELRMKFWLQNHNISMGPWAKFVKRDLLIKNNIKFLNMATQQDSVWTFELICLAKNIVMVPHICYVYRQRSDSIFNSATGVKLTPDSIYKKFDRIVKGLKHMDNFMGKIEFFKKNPVYRYAVIDKTVMQNINWISRSYSNVSPLLIYDNLKTAFKNDTGEFDVLISYLVSSFIGFLRNYEVMQEKFMQNKSN